MAKELKNLMKAIEELNAPVKLEDGETMESEFRFVLEPQGNGTYHLYDANECYHIEWYFDRYYMLCDVAREFGFDEPEDANDRVMEKLEKALQMDVGKEAYIDWYDNVRMCFTTEW